ncbi:MAG: DUF3817 domain-containing protein [Streptosporangiaceae bacterium]
MSGAVARYRVMAYITGTLLLVLVFVAVPLKYGAGDPTLVSIVGPIHGFLYILYLAAGFDLSRRCRWPLPQTILLLLAGTIPVLTFVVERLVVTRWLRLPAGAPPEPAE